MGKKTNHSGTLTIMLSLFILTGFSFTYFQDVFAQNEQDSFSFPNGGVVEYTLENGQVNGMEIDQSIKSLIVDITAFGDGNLVLLIPRDVLDAKDGYNESVFFVLVNGEEVEFDEQTTPTHRIVSVQTINGDTEVEIVGTQVLTLSSNQQAQPNPSTESTTYYVYVDEPPEWADYVKDVVVSSTKAWEDTIPELEFIFVDAETDANLKIQWVKEFGVEHVGYAYNDQFIEIGLGDSGCLETWHAYSPNHVSWIMMHELGHVLGFEHSSDPNSLMYPTAPPAQYDIVEEKVTLTEGYLQFSPFCASSDVTSYAYSVTTDDPQYGFDVYVVPSSVEFENAVAGKSFKYYKGSECFGENYQSFGGKCDGVSAGGGLLIAIDDRQTNKLTNLTVKQQEFPEYNGVLQSTESATITYEYPERYQVKSLDDFRTNESNFSSDFNIPEQRNADTDKIAVTDPQKTNSEQEPKLTCGEGTVEKDGICVVDTEQPETTEESSKGGGCLIATATYGSELAPQVQQLREIRDNQLLQTASGTAFMSSFNNFYYSFSPTVADWERQNPVFKDVVKITITPMLSTLSILNYADIDSENEMLGYGISLIILNLGMYIIIPACVVLKIRSKFS